MSLLIKGMKMPKNCLACAVRFGKICGQRIYGDMRECTLVEVPTPHGPLIDEQEALDHFDIYKTPSRETVDFMAIGYNHGVADCQAILKGLPTIIEAEEGADE